MASIGFIAKDIFEQRIFDVKYVDTAAEADEFLDDVIMDYETYAAWSNPFVKRFH